MSDLPPGPPSLIRQKSEIEKELERNSVQAEALVKQAKADEAQPHFQYDMELKGCVFVGHTNTDLDSIAAAIAAAHLFDGTPARASEINTETEWVLERWGFKCPEMFAKIEGVQDRDVCLVDFNQRSQLTQGVKESKIKGIIDHHALRDGAVAVDYPIYIDVRPWGSVATILSHTYFRNRKKLPKDIAGLLLSAILSDTLNLNSPTCTDIDKLMVATLSKIAEVKDVDGLAEKQFKAKSKMLLRYSIPEILRGDLKRFNIQDIIIAFGVCETTDTKTVLEKKDEILDEMKAMKTENQDTFVFFAIIDVAKLNSQLLICGEAEKELAEKAYDAKMDEKTSVIDLGDRVSRKKTMVPPLGSLIKSGFKLSKKAEAANKAALSKEAQEQVGKLQLVYDENCVGEIRRVGGKFKKAALALKALNAFKR
eukprot:CAMPEP_0114510532 /NCGR_PEP_ID=MMETSP0109-20121206/13850_1 /TAXON_ID=29199 /ORGANISM="Chlorarachnion reptans, Strain CCCM449" /LENGTH=423 /DNA_ID=CAMNT_0001689871 /DNA_START=208 /DNA_END=1479 /DNA_ORIENTATION=+